MGEHWTLESAAREKAPGLHPFAGARLRVFLRHALLTPRLDLLPRVQEQYEYAIANFPDQHSIREAYQYFLANAVIIAYSYNRQQEAGRLLAELRGRYPDYTAAEDLDTFVFDTYRNYVADASPDRALAVVESALYQSAFWRAIGDEGQAEGFERIGALCWEQYMAPRQDPEFRERTGLPPLPEIARRAGERARAEFRAHRARMRDFYRPMEDGE